MGFVHLHCHSHFSVFDSISKPSEIASRVKSLEQEAVALTDHATMSGVVSFYNECKKNEVKPIIGCEIYFVPDPELKDRGNHLVLLAKNNVGYHNLLKLIGISSEHRYYKPRVPLSVLEQYHEGLVCLSACMASIINTEDGEFWASKFKSIFGEDFYLEIQSNSLPEQIIYNSKVIDIANRLNIELVVTCDSHYPNKEDSEVHRKWVFCNRKEQEDYYTTQDFYLQSEMEIRGYLGAYISDEILSRAIENTGTIAKLCNVSIEVTGNHYPVFKCEDQLEEVKKICREGWKKKIIPKVPKCDIKKYLDRLMYEFDVLEKCNYLNYLLILSDIIKWSRENGILVGPGRGSAAGSLVCYLMDITQLDPIKHGLLFERFVNLERVSAADIDVDFERDRRGEVIEYIKQTYGHVYNIRTFNYLGIKNAIRRAGQTLAKSSTEINQASKGQESWGTVKIDEEWLSLAKKFEGLIDSFGCHASAVLIFPDDPSNYCSIEIQGDTMVAAYDYHDLELQNLLKLDILGLANLSVITNTIKLIGDDIDIYNLPLDDKNVYDIYARGELSSVFQSESSGMIGLAQKTKVHCFEEVVALVALYRPGPLEAGMVDQYIDGKFNGDVKYLHPNLEPILKDTYSVIVYQESVMEIVQVMAGMTLGEADLVRRIIGRKELDKIESAVNEFVKRSISNGYSEEVAVEIGRQIKACGGYIFNKCISGDTLLSRPSWGCDTNSKEIPISMAYEVWNSRTPTGKKYRDPKKGLYLQSLDNDGRIRKDRVKNIYKSGIKEVYCMTLKNGSSIKATLDHRFKSIDGYKRMGDLAIGDFVCVAGTYEEQTSLELSKFNLTNVKHKSSKGSSYPSQCGFPKGENNPAFINGNHKLFNDNAAELKKEGFYCRICGESRFEKRYEVHHIDNNHQNQEKSNLTLLCVSCHKKEHYKMGRRRRFEKGYPSFFVEIESINYVGKEMTYDVEMCGDTHNFVANGMVTHNSHAAAYGYLSYVTAYLKVHYPLRYMCSVLNNEVGDLEKAAEYINECKRMDIEILPPDINRSGKWFTVEHNSIRFGLGSIKNCGNVVGEIIEKRPFTSLDDILDKCSSKINKRVIESLLKAGALSNIDNRPMGYLLAYLANAKETVKKRKLAIEDIVPLEVNEAQCELEVIGLFLTKNPFNGHEKYLRQPYCISYEEFQNLQVKEGKYGRKESSQVIVGGLLVSKSDKEKRAKNGSVFGFIDVEFIDGGKVSLIAFKEVWESIRNDVNVNSVVRVKAVKSGDEKGQALQIHVL